MTIICTKCEVEKPEECFYTFKNKDKIGRRRKCIKCVSVENSADNKKKRRAEYRSLHREEASLATKRWLANHPDPDYQKKKSREHYLQNKHLWNERRAKRRETHPDENKESFQRRRARLAGIENTMPKNYMEILIGMYGNKCMNPSCQKQEVTLDHIVPIFLGGAHSIDNAQLLCKSCNSCKGHRQIIDYRTQ